MHDPTSFIPWDDVCFIDCETRSCPDQSDVEVAGNLLNTSSRRYAANAWPIVITWAYGLEGPVQRWETKDVTRPPTLDELPLELREWGQTLCYFAAWNSGFDRAILDRYFHAHVDGWLDMMAHAAYNNLPLGLDRAAKACGLDGKIGAGKRLIKLFCSPDGARPEDEPEEWQKFLEYADVDVEQMQAVAAATFPVPISIWKEFWTSEVINDRGLPIDRTMAEGGARLADEYTARLGDRVKEITGGEMYSIRQYVKQREWVWERIRGNDFVAHHMVKAHRVNEETGEDEYVLEMDRPRITKMIAALQTLNEKEGLTDDEFDVLQLLTEREWGASAAPAKFQKMLDMALDRDRLPNQYVFSGATQTGRYSSRGVQVHNMTRSTVSAIDRPGA